MCMDIHVRALQRRKKKVGREEEEWRGEKKKELKIESNPGMRTRRRRNNEINGSTRRGSSSGGTRQGKRVGKRKGKGEDLEYRHGRRRTPRKRAVLRENRKDQWSSERVYRIAALLGSRKIGDKRIGKRCKGKEGDLCVRQEVKDSTRT